MLNFDEFAAVKNRERGAAVNVPSTNTTSTTEAAAAAAGNKSPSSPAKTPKAADLNDLKTETSSGKAKKGSSKSGKSSAAAPLSTLGVLQAAFKGALNMLISLVEQNELQGAYAVLLLLDTFSAMLIMLIQFGTMMQDLNGSSGSSSGEAGGPTVTMMGDAGATAGTEGAASGFSNLAVVNTVLSYIAAVFTNVFTLPGGFHHPAVTVVLLPLLHAVCSFALFLSFVEIVLVVVAFGLATLRHVGYVVDVTVLCAQVYEELKVIPPLTGTAGGSVGAGMACVVSYRVFNLLRCWRFVRLYAAFIAVEVNKHSATKRVLEDKVKDCKVLEIERYKLQNDLRKEKESLAAVESMLTNYKEEVGTLNEALKIAAMDIAEIAQTEEDDEGDDAGDEDDELLRGLDGVSDAEAMARLQAALNEPMNNPGAQRRAGHTHSHGAEGATHGQGTKNVDQLYKQLRTDNNSGSGTKKSPSAASTGGGGASTTFVVKDDGSFGTQNS